MPRINELSSVDSLSVSDLMAVFSQNNGDTRKASLNTLLDFLRDNLALNDGKVTQYAAPSSTGFTATIDDSGSSAWLILTPTGTLAAGTIVLPSLANAEDKQEVLVNSTQNVTSLTINANGATVTGGPTTIAANGFFRLRFDAVTNTWYRV